MKYRLFDLFSGIGGFSLGLERSGNFETVAFCEIDPTASAVLARHWPDVPIFGDIAGVDFGHIMADAICGGFPCQDISYAGRGAGLAGERSGLYRHIIRAVRVVRPQIIVLENVAALLDRGLGEVLGDLASVGYDSEWRCVRASAVGAPHGRDRIWIVAYPNGSRREGLVTGANFSSFGSWGWGGEADLQLVADAPFSCGDRWPQPLLRRVDDGLPRRVDRLKQVGNAIVPQIAEIIGRAIGPKLSNII